MGIADRIILYPYAVRQTLPGTERRVLPIPEGGEVEAFRVPAPDDREPRAFLVGLGGNAGRAGTTLSRFSPFWRGMDIEAWAFNYPGYGGSPGPALLANLAPAARTVFDAVYARAAGRPVIVLGDSLGGCLSMHIASARPAAGVIVRNAPPLPELVSQCHGWWNWWVANWLVVQHIPPELDARRNAARVTAPGLFIRAQCDRTVPRHWQEMLFDAYAGPKTMTVQTRALHNTPPSAKSIEAARAFLAPFAIV